MPNNKSLQKGDIFKNRDLANTYLSIAESYGSSFYSGTLAKSMTEFIQEQGGYLTIDDMKSFQPQWVEPVSTNYRGYDVWELPPNGQGCLLYTSPSPRDLAQSRMPSYA